MSALADAVERARLNLNLAEHLDSRGGTDASRGLAYLLTADLRLILDALTWRPIESAPRDGKEFLAKYDRQGGVVILARFNTVFQCWETKGDPLKGFATNATRWCSVPAAPPQPREVG